MNDNCSYIGPSAPLDDKAVDAYEMIQGSLQLKEDSESFMDVVTTTMIFEPSLITMENILFIIDDKRSRHEKILNKSGRQMLRDELDLLENFMENTDAMVDFYYDKYEWDETTAIHTPEELITVFHQIMYAYRLCYWLRDYAASNNKLMAQLALIKAKIERSQQNAVEDEESGSPDY